MRGKPGVAAGHGSLVSALADPAPAVRVVAAECLARFGEPADETLALRVLADHAQWREDIFTAIAALNSLAQLGDRAEPIKARLRKLPAGTAPHQRYEDYVSRLLAPENLASPAEEELNK
jgi:hypothetical protein